MPLVITLHTATSIPLEVDSIVMETVRTQSADDVQRTLVQRGNKQVPLGEFCDITDASISGICVRVRISQQALRNGPS